MYIHMSSNMTDISDVPVMDDAEETEVQSETTSSSKKEWYDMILHPSFLKAVALATIAIVAVSLSPISRTHQRSCVGARATSSLRTNHQRSDIGIHHHIPPSADGHGLRPARYTYKIDSRRVSYHGDKPLRTYVQQRGGRTCLYVQTTSPKIFSDSGCCGCGGPNVKLYMGRLVCDDCEAVNGSYIDSLPEWRSTPADGSKHTERCGVVGSDLYTSSIWGA
jgi:hypothetical protein